MATPLSLQLSYFAILREQRGLAHETLTTAATTPRALYREIASVYSFSLPVEAIGVAINDSFASLDQALAAGDRVCFLPPVAGG